MRTFLLTFFLLFGIVYAQTSYTYGGNYTTSTGEQRTINIVPAEDGFFEFIDARSDGMDQQRVEVLLPSVSETITASLASGEFKITASGNTYEVRLDDMVEPILLIRQKNNP